MSNFDLMVRKFNNFFEVFVSLITTLPVPILLLGIVLYAFKYQKAGRILVVIAAVVLTYGWLFGK